MGHRIQDRISEARQATKEIEVMLSRLRINHITHSYLLKIEDPPKMLNVQSNPSQLNTFT